jgi:2-C-methyl-D-erythritol 4-phosphate cytidylyltransferase/2-C-methyl-D-erythritol 2,4-cyclodiphosphate synthase
MSNPSDLSERDLSSESTPSVAVILVAAGAGSRLGMAEPKAFVDVGNRTIFEHALSTVFDMAGPAQIVVVAPESLVDRAREIASVVGGSASSYVTVVPGGDSRQQSVIAGLAALDPAIDVVLVHDCARAFTPVAQFDSIVAAVSTTRAGVIPGLAVADTIKKIDESGAVERTIDRSELVSVQTPQGFPRAELVAAYAAANQDYTDDAALYAAAGHAVSVVDGDPLAFKITTLWDLRRAESIVAAASAVSATPVGMRTGVGIDIHGFDDASPLWLGGLYWPDEPGLSGHSDGDAVSHAVCDALLSAAGLGDIGGRFGTSEERFRGAHGDVFIEETVALVSGAGFTIGNVAVQVIATRPKIAGRRVELESHLSLAVGAPVSVSATTSDGLGFTGDGRGLTAIATALLHY